MKTRKGFVGTVFAVVVALFLLLTSAYVFNLGFQNINEETWITSNMERSLYPIAWSTTNFVLHSLRDEAPDFTGNASKVFLSSDASGNPVFGAKNTIPWFDVGGVASCEVTVLGGKVSGFYVYCTASSDIDGIHRRKTVRGLLSPDVSPDWKVVWR